MNLTNRILFLFVAAIVFVAWVLISQLTKLEVDKADAYSICVRGAVRVTLEKVTAEEFYADRVSVFEKVETALNSCRYVIR